MLDGAGVTIAEIRPDYRAVRDDGDKAEAFTGFAYPQNAVVIGIQGRDTPAGVHADAFEAHVPGLLNLGRSVVIRGVDPRKGQEAIGVGQRQLAQFLRFHVSRSGGTVPGAAAHDHAFVDARFVHFLQKKLHTALLAGGNGVSAHAEGRHF